MKGAWATPKIFHSMKVNKSCARLRATFEGPGLPAIVEISEPPEWARPGRVQQFERLAERHSHLSSRLQKGPEIPMKSLSVLLLGDSAAFNCPAEPESAFNETQQNQGVCQILAQSR